MFNIYFIIALVVAVTVHEFAHAWMATFLGDPTARMQGRLSLNPLKHLDPVGTIMLFMAGIGWGKPVPYDPRHLKKPLRDGALIALAGPLSNLLVVFVLAVPFRMLISFADPYSFSITLLETVITLNLVLMIFNLMPIPPLDGSKVVFSILPPRFHPILYRYRNYGYGVLILVLLSPHLFGISVLGRVISPVVETVWQVILS